MVTDLDRLRAAGWSPESLQRALVDEDKENVQMPSKSVMENLIFKFDRHLRINSPLGKAAPRAPEPAPAPNPRAPASAPTTVHAAHVLQPSTTIPAVLAPSVVTSHEAMIRAADLDRPLPNGWTLFQHQKDAVVDCIKLGRAIMAFDMGLGKTLIALIWAKAVATVVPGCATVVIVPCTLIEVWRREATMLGFDVYGLGTLASRFSITIHSWAKIPTPAEIGRRKYLLIADEAHAMQSFTSQRTRAVLQLTGDASCIGCLLATGTPMRNGRPCNLYPLLVGIRHPVARNKIEYDKTYCAARKTKFVAWDTSGASNLPQLRAAIGPSLMRKTKEECLDIPLLTRRTVHVDVAAGAMAEYDALLDEMRREVKQQHAAPGGGKKGGGSALELMSRLRVFTSKAKVTGAAAVVRAELQRCPDPVVVFVWFKETVAMLLEALAAPGTDGPLRCVSLTGDVVRHEVRTAVVDRFQGGELDVLVCTYGVGAVGLTLTRSHTVVLLDRPWTPGDASQAEDRVRRIGQRSDQVDSIWIEAFSLDQKLDAMLASKASNTAKVLVAPAPAPAQAPAAAVNAKRHAAAPTKTIKDFFSGTGTSASTASGCITVAPPPAIAISGEGGQGARRLSPASDLFGDAEMEVETDSVASLVFKQLLCGKN